MLKSGFKQFLSACNDLDLLNWIDQNVSFPCCMVDRITPRANPKHAIDVLQRFAIKDELTIMGESFIQWIVEDNFSGRRPPLDKVGVQFVQDVSPYEDVKIRILNAGHTVVVYLAALKGYTTFDEGMRDPELNELFLEYETNEAIPAITHSPIDLIAYRDVVKARFCNANIADTVARICADGVSKFPIFVLPTLEGAYKRNVVPEYALKGIASWYVFMCHASKERFEFDYIEPKWDDIEPFLQRGNEHLFAQNQNLWGQLPNTHPEFSNHIVDAINVMYERFPY